jgi:hypothetical protein
MEAKERKKIWVLCFLRIIEKIHGFLYKENGVSHIQRKSRNTENINQVHKFRPISRVKNPKRVFTS